MRQARHARSGRAIPPRRTGAFPTSLAVSGSASEVALAFADAHRMLHNRIGLFAALPIEALDRISIKREMDKIGRAADEPARA